MINQAAEFPVIASRLYYWLLGLEENFRLPDLGSRDLFTSLKPAGELSLVFFARYQKGGHLPPPLSGLIESMWNSYQGIQNTPYWSLLWSFIHENECNSEIWQLFLHLEILKGKKFSFHDEIVCHLISLQHEGRKLSSTLDYTCELAGGNSALRSGAKEITLLIRADRRGELQPSELYGLTHAIFYATRFGTRRLPADMDQDALQQLLLKGLVLAAEIKCLDITAELLACLHYVKAPAGLERTSARQRLLANLTNDQERPLKTGNRYCKKKDYFSQHYHLVLTTLLAIN